MGLYRYSIEAVGGKTATGQITAKTEAEARERVATKTQVRKWISIEEVPPAASPAKPKAVAAASLSKLERMLYLQSGRCFFCGEQLVAKDASIEHLNPKSKGGTNGEDNVVVCHATLNAAFGSLALKQKFEFVLRSAGKFRCPVRS